MEAKIEKLMRVDGSTEEQLAAAQAETNRLARERFAEALDRIDRGENVEAFGLGIAFRDEDQCAVTMGGDGRATVALLDLLHWGIIKQTVNNGVLLPGLPSRLDVARQSEVVDPFDLIQTVIIATSLVEEMSERNAANEADAAIQRASA